MDEMFIISAWVLALVSSDTSITWAWQDWDTSAQSATIDWSFV